ncbi:hypothetical protein Ddc_05466 [Ditylenchus destructor]|nr:hypothetical protein Ddc_05466 [Ditylenchus destructor]
MRKLSFTTALCILFSILACVLIPGFAILAYYQHVLYIFPAVWTLQSTLFYIVKAIISTFLMIVALVLYSDVAFPLVMYSFGKIFSRIDLK